MSQRISRTPARTPSPALVVAVCALVVALGGTAYAALPKHSVGAAQLKKDAVRSVAVKNHSLTVKDFAKDQLAGDVYLKNVGDDLVDVAALVSETPTVVSSATLPEGRYYVRAGVVAINSTAALQGDLRCFLHAATVLAGGTTGLYVPIEPNAGTNANRAFFSLDAAVRMRKKGAVTVECTKGGLAQTISAGASIAAVTTRKATALP